MLILIDGMGIIVRDTLQNNLKRARSKFRGWEMSVAKDEKTGQLVTTVAMPQFPGLDTILETAEKMYSFVNQGVTFVKK